MTSAAYIMARRPRAVWDRSASDSRLLLISSPTTVSLNKPPSGDGRSIDSPRQALLLGNHCRDNAPLTGRVFLARLPIAGEPQHPAIGGTRAIAPSHDSSVVTIGELRFNHDGLESMPPFLKVVERHCWTDIPHTEIFSTFVHILKNVWGRRRIVADVEHPLRRTTGIGAGLAAFLRKSPGPSIASPSPVAASLVGAFPVPSPVAASLVGAFPVPSPVAASLVGAFPVPSPVAASLVGAFPVPSPVAASLVGAFPVPSPVAASLVGPSPLRGRPITANPSRPTEATPPAPCHAKAPRCKSAFGGRDLGWGLPLPPLRHSREVGLQAERPPREDAPMREYIPGVRPATGKKSGDSRYNQNLCLTPRNNQSPATSCGTPSLRLPNIPTS